MELCRKLIRANPADRFASAERAIDATEQFRHDLVFGWLAVPWDKIKQWTKFAKKAQWDADQRS
jgi:hypothetical protein